MNRRTLAQLACLLATAALAGCTAPSDESESDEEVGEAEQAQVVCADGATIEGIDVSVWQANVNWGSVKAAGIDFAFARAAYSTSKDDYFDQNWAGMKSAGIVRGAYLYWRPDKDPIAQADVLLGAIGTLESTDLPPVIDVEETDGVGPALLTERLAQVLDHVESKTGRKAIIYSGKYFWQDNVKSDAFLDYPLWIPNYSLDCPDMPTGFWDKWAFFQYTSTGHVNGVSGNVDRDVFNGTLDDLYAFAAQGSAKYGAKFVSQSFPYASEAPKKMFTGQDYEVSLTLKNTGTEPWDENTRIGTTEPRDHDSPFAGPEWPGKNRYAQVQGKVMPGETYEFKWVMHAPDAPGTYDEHMGLVQEGVAWFSDAGQGGPPDGQLEGIFKVEQARLWTDSFDPFTGEPRPRTDDDGSGGSDGDGDNVQQGGCATAPSGAGAPSGAWLFAALGLAGWLGRRQRRGAA